VAATVTRARLLAGVDIGATFVFAVEGALAGAAARVDVLGLLVVAFATALGGGIARDLIIGAVPPAAFRSTLYPLTAFAGAVVVMVLHTTIAGDAAAAMDVLDAVGLALFSVVGAAKALDFGLNPLSAVMLGAVTAVGGGVMRNVLLDEIPPVLQADVYATAALLGATVMVLASLAGVTRSRAMAAGAAACFALRMLAIWFDWNLPRWPSVA
jgi:uncharacterized membrane protein YeiH